MPVISGGSSSKNEIEFLRDLEKDGKLISLVSSVFSGVADQLTYTVPSGKTFYLLGIKLVPVSGFVIHSYNNDVVSRYCYVSLTFDGVLKDVLTWYYESNESSSGTLYGGSGGNGSFDGLAKIISLAGDGVKQVKLSSTSVSGSYRVSLLGFIE
jgi:hypothetical protein